MELVLDGIKRCLREMWKEVDVGVDERVFHRVHISKQGNKGCMIRITQEMGAEGCVHPLRPIQGRRACNPVLSLLLIKYIKIEN